MEELIIHKYQKELINSQFDTVILKSNKILWKVCLKFYLT